VPQEEIRRGTLWAKFSFLIDYNEFQMIYVTQASDQRLFVLALTSQSSHQKEDERAFYKTLDSLVIKDIEREYTLPLEGAGGN
jgi:hypothetical protein